MSNAYRPIPTPEIVKDQNIRRIVEPVRHNVQLLQSGLASLQNRVSSLTGSPSGAAPAAQSSTGLVSRWISGTFQVGAPLAEGIHEFGNLAIPAGAIIVNAFGDIQSSFIGDSQQTTMSMFYYSREGEKIFIFPHSDVALYGGVGYVQGRQTGLAESFTEKPEKARALNIEILNGTVISGRLRMFIEMVLSEV